MSVFVGFFINFTLMHGVEHINYILMLSNVMYETNLNCYDNKFNHSEKYFIIQQIVVT
jgi:hypothetical protein